MRIIIERDFLGAGNVPADQQSISGRNWQFLKIWGNFGFQFGHRFSSMLEIGIESGRKN